MAAVVEKLATKGLNMSDHHRDDLANNNGMARWDGLYHGGRRVRAQIGYSAGFVPELGWLIAPDEKDLIATLGTSWFPDDVNKADLK